jgi:tetratricopeptide (TPR) repeat protein
MFELKRLSKAAVPAALEKAQRYRLLNEPQEAESICLDVLEVEPENQRALTTLLLALTDQFEERLAEAVPRAREVLERLRDPYSQAYYEGLVHERKAKAQLRRGGLGAAHAVYEGLHRAMACFERAAALRPTGDDEALLRWNTCARLLMSHRELVPAPPDAGEQMLE